MTTVILNIVLDGQTADQFLDLLAEMNTRTRTTHNQLAKSLLVSMLEDDSASNEGIWQAAQLEAFSPNVIRLADFRGR